LFFAIFMIKSGGISALQQGSIIRQWGNARVLDYRNSVYGNVAVTGQKEQYTFFYNGLPIITTPFPDKQFIEDFANFPLLFHPRPEEVLFIGGGAGGLIGQALKHPLKRLDYTELDPLLIEMLKKYPSALTEAELNDSRVNIKNVDARFFLKNSENKYDLILIGLPKPADLSSNRHFSKEFFSLAKEKLKEGGMLAFWLPGSFTYLSAELKNLNACILNAVKNSYNYLRVIPGDYNIILASDSEQILQAGPLEILQRLSERNIKDTLLLPAYLEYRLDPEKTKWFFRSLEGATKKINSDFRPFALFEVLSIWNKQFSKRITALYQAMQELELLKIFLAVSALTVFLFFILRKGAPARITVAYCIFSSGFFGMLSSLILIFAFQVVYGYLYRSIGLLIGLFMAGTAAGSIFMSSRLEKISRDFKLFAALEILIIGFCVLLGLIITGLPQRSNYSLLVFLALFFICGLFLGLEFPLAAKIYLKRKSRIGEASGILYGADLIGGWLAGVAGGIIFLPILGLFNTCLVMGIFKLSSLSLLLSARKTIKNPS
ncbi:MAG: spermine synthase, partial [Candidatus Omnitrophota bacterium]|nr:spermine synthase [Candidatus Omnitrophota bacterium]